MNSTVNLESLYQTELDEDTFNASIMATEDLANPNLEDHYETTIEFVEGLREEGVEAYYIYSPVFIWEGKVYETRLAVYKTMDAVVENVRGKMIFVYCAMKRKQQGDRQVRFIMI